MVSGWNTINLPSPVAVTSGTTYWLALNSNAACYYYLDGGTMVYNVFAYADSFPNPAGNFSRTYAYYSISQGWGTPPSAPGIAPELLSPGTAITFKWGTSTGASKYWLQVNTSQAFTGTNVIDANVGSLTLSEVAGFSLGTTYYWRVRAGNDSGWSDWSPSRSFTISQLP